MKNCVVFAAFVNDDIGLLRLDNIITILEQYFINDDIFIGINPCSHQELIIEYFSKSKLSFRYNITPNHLVINSDASAYQTALKLLKNCEKIYDNIFFFHTKTVSPEYFINFFSINKEEYINLLHSNELFGAIGEKLLLVSKFPEKSGLSNILSKYYNFNYGSLEYFYSTTFFMIKGKILHNFINNCNNSFFEELLTTPHEPKGDRYYFERDFIHIVDKQGYLLLTKNVEIVGDGRYKELLNIDLKNFYKTQVKDWGKHYNILIDDVDKILL